MQQDIFDRAMCSYNEGITELEANNYKSAVDNFNSAIDEILSIGEDNLTKEMYLYLADSFYRIAGTYVISRNYSDAVINFKSGLLACKNGDMLDTAVAGIIYYRLGEVNYITGKKERLIYYYQKAISSLKTSAEKMIDELVICYERIISALEDLELYDKALVMLDKYEAFANEYLKENDNDPGFYSYEKGNIYYTIKQYDKALASFGKSFTTIIEKGKFNGNIMSLFQKIGEIEEKEYHQYENAVAMYKRAVVFGKENNLEKDELLETCAYKVAELDSILGEHKEAVQYCDYVIEILNQPDLKYEVNNEDYINVYIMAANCYNAASSYSNALHYLEEAKSIAEEIQDDKISRKVYMALGECYYSLGDYETAIEYLTEADVRFEDEEWDDLDLAKICDLEAKAYQKLEDSDLSIIYLRRKKIIEEENQLVVKK